jgi:hypothetical protein
MVTPVAVAGDWNSSVDNIKAAGIGEPLARAYMCSQGLPGTPQRLGWPLSVSIAAALGDRVTAPL